MNWNKTIYWAATIIMCGVFTFSAFMYFSKTELIKMAFANYGFPAWIVIPLAIAKVLGIIAVISKYSKMLTDWAYAGFFFDALIAFIAHSISEDGGELFSIIAIISLVVSRSMLPKAFPKFA